MATKHDLRIMMEKFGYDLNPYTSKETLVNLLHLHSKALEKGIDIPKLNDHELRTSLREYNIEAGPIISHTRAIYQRKLLEAITSESSEGIDDEAEVDDDEFHTPPIQDNCMVTRSGKTIFFDAK